MTFEYNKKRSIKNCFLDPSMAQINPNNVRSQLRETLMHFNKKLGKNKLNKQKRRDTFLILKDISLEQKNILKTSTNENTHSNKVVTKTADEQIYPLISKNWNVRYRKVNRNKT